MSGSGAGPTGPDGHERSDEVGSVGEEAAKLFGALSEWARDHTAGGSEAMQGLSGLVGAAASAATEINEHLATGAPECTYCPVCRTVHVVRSTSPEVRAHLSAAASSLLQAATGLLATLPPPPGGAPAGSSTFERIDLDADRDADLDDTGNTHSNTDDGDR